MKPSRTPPKPEEIAELVQLYNRPAVWAVVIEKALDLKVEPAQTTIQFCGMRGPTLFRVADHYAAGFLFPLSANRTLRAEITFYPEAIWTGPQASIDLEMIEAGGRPKMVAGQNLSAQVALSILRGEQALQKLNG